MKTVKNIIFILTVGLTSCNPFNNKLDISNATLFINKLADFDSLKTLSYSEKEIGINDYRTSTDLKYIHQEDSIGFIKIYHTDSIIQKLSFDQTKFYEFLKLFKGTNSYNFDRNDSIYYFICNSFLDDSNGMIFSKRKLRKWTGNNIEDIIILNEHYVDSWTEYKDNWYNATGGN